MQETMDLNDDFVVSEKLKEVIENFENTPMMNME